MEVDISTTDTDTRNSEDILELLEHAKLNPKELISCVQTLHFSPSYGGGRNFELLEVDTELLGFLNEGQRLTIRGESEDQSVICTNNKTFEIKEAETSNSLLLVPNLSVPKDQELDQLNISYKEVVSVHYKYYELRHCQPRLKKLQNLLEDSPYKGSTSTNYGYELKELLNRIQSSEDELMMGLKRIKAYYIEDRWCLLDFDYHFGLLSSILNYIEENSIPLFAVNKREIISNLQENGNSSILEQCFQYFFVSSDSIEGTELYKVIENEVSQFCAEVLLKSAGKFNLHEFLNIWQQSVPEGVKTHLSQLKGLALVDRGSSPPVIWHFPVSKLPSDVSRAFQILFDTQKKWTLEEISPYIHEFTSSKQNISTLLNKYTRVSTVNGVKYFTAKHRS